MSYIVQTMTLRVNAPHYSGNEAPRLHKRWLDFFVVDSKMNSTPKAKLCTILQKDLQEPMLLATVALGALHFSL